MVVEVMGRNTGWIAVFSGIAGGADAIVIPELELTVEEIGDAINARHERGKNFSIVVVAEGAELAFASGEKRQVRASPETDQYGYPRLGGIGSALAREIEAAHRIRDARHDARPRAARRHADRHRSRARDPLRRQGGRAASSGEFGRMAALHGTEMTSVPLSEVEGVKQVDLAYLQLAGTFFG